MNQAVMYSDICRVHIVDEILLYLEKPKSDKLRDGGSFIGIFEIISQRTFYESKGEYLKDQLWISLIYRLLIKPKKIYSNGLTE